MVKFCKIILFFVAFVLLPISVKAADLYITPSNATFEIGDPITLQVVVSSNSPINAISSSILFPPSIFSIDSVSKASSILNFWTTEPTFSKTTGIVNLEGVSLGGFLGTTGNVVTIRMRAMKSGVGQITFKSGQILANDGKGTDLTVNLKGSTLNIKESTPKPIQTKEPVKEPVKVEEEIPEIEITEPLPVATIIPQLEPVILEQSLVSRYGELAIISFIILLILIIIYQSYRLSKTSQKHLSKKVRHGVDNIIVVVHKSFDILRDDVRDRKFTFIKKDLDDAEDLITRKIKDIESL